MKQICQEESKSTCSNVCHSVEGKDVDNMCTYLLGDHLNLLSDGYLQSSNGVRVVLVDMVLEEPPEEEIFSRLSKWGAYSTSALQLMRCSLNFSWSHAMVTLAVWGSTPSWGNHCSSSSWSSWISSSPHLRGRCFVSRIVKDPVFFIKTSLIHFSSFFIFLFLTDLLQFIFLLISCSINSHIAIIHQGRMSSVSIFMKWSFP